jgi:hypothetical protein
VSKVFSTCKISHSIPSRKTSASSDKVANPDPFMSISCPPPLDPEVALSSSRAKIFFKFN